MMSNARPNVSRQTARWTSDVDKDRAALRAEFELLKSQVNVIGKAQSANSTLLGDRGFKTDPAVFATSDSDGFLANINFSNPTQYTNVGIPIPSGYTRALINMTGSMNAINSGVGSDTIQLSCDPFYNLDPTGDPAANTYLNYSGACMTPLDGSGTAVSATMADVSVAGGGPNLYVGLLSYFSGGTAGNITGAEIRVSGSVIFYRE